MSMVPITIMERGEVTAPILAMAVSRKPGTGNPLIRRANPKNTVMIHGFSRILRHFVLRSAVVNTDSPAVHMKIRLGIIKMEAANNPSFP